MGELFLWVWVCFLDFVVLLWQHLHNSTQDVMERVTFNQLARGKTPLRNDPTIIKTQLHPESQHKWHKGRSKTIKVRRSRRLHHLISQVSYHRNSHHKSRESKQINLRNRSKQEKYHKQWEDKETTPNQKERRNPQKEC